ncbi:hypothetical protein OAQ96_00150 [Alphaproteobacteria bacterium]|nr:hypothetical protein [Alphaproteobacteria bacterium]
MPNSQQSKKYFENIEYYKKMHVDGYKLSNGKIRTSEEAYNGKSTLIFAKLIKEIIKKNKIKTMLDYGCGKGFFYKNPSNQNGLQIKSLRNYWDIDIDLYDPCFDENSYLNEDKNYDLLICVDVLEHIPTEDIYWILEKLMTKAKKYLFINVACYPAIALLPNGKNAHINIQPPKWWHEKILNFQDKLQHIKVICICTIIEDGKFKYFPLQYNDKLTNYSSK